MTTATASPRPLTAEPAAGSALTGPPPSPPTAPDPQWDEAYLRVESYLRAHQLESRILLNELAAEIVREARLRQGEGADEPLVLAMQVANGRMAAWFNNILGTESAAQERIGVRGRLALAMADVPRRWPQYFLRPETPPPAEMVQAMRAAYIEAGPELQFSNMAPRPIDLGPIANVAGETWRTFLRWPLLRAVTGWAIILAMLAIFWVLTR